LARVEVDPEDKLMYAMLEPLGIAPRQPFQPDDLWPDREATSSSPSSTAPGSSTTSSDPSNTGLAAVPLTGFRIGWSTGPPIVGTAKLA
jgi:hypothetical protein